MAINHDIATMRPGHQSDIGGDSTAGLAAAALLLALVLGFSAIDIQRQRAPDAELAGGLYQEQNVFDGRGKWAGYM